MTIDGGPDLIRRAVPRCLSCRPVLAAASIGLALLASAGSALRAQSTNADLLVDFLAVDGSGVPVRDLRPQDVAVRVGRDTVDVRLLRFVPAVAGDSDARRRTTLDFSNPEVEAVQRSFLVVVDDESLPQGSEQSTRDSLAGFVEGLDVADQVGFASVPHAGVRSPLSLEHRPVIQAMRQISGRATSRESAQDAGCRARNVLSQLDFFLAGIGGDNRPLIVVFVSGSMYDGGGWVQAPFGTSIACDLQMAEFERLGRRAAEVRSYVYIVQPETFANLSWTSNPRAGLEHVAGATGGKILQLSGRDGSRLSRVSRETSGFYLATVRLRARPRAGSVQPLSVRVLRDGVDVVARPQVVVP